MIASWQDGVFTFGALVFIIALIPAVKGPNKPPLSTSLVTGCTLGVFALTFASLDLWYSAATEAAVSALWLVVAVQVALGNKEKPVGEVAA
jgi:hypothetical protein